MAPEEERWTKRGDGQWTDDECDEQAAPNVAPAPGSFGHRLARFTRTVAKPVEAPKEAGGEQKPAEEEHSGGLLRHSDAVSKAGSESSASSAFRASPVSKASSPPHSNESHRRPAFRGRFNKLRSTFEDHTNAPESGTAFPPPPGGFGGSHGRSGRRARGNYQPRPQLRPGSFGPRNLAMQAPLRKMPTTLQQPSVDGFPTSRKGPAIHLVPVKNLTLVGSADSDVVEVSTDADHGKSTTTTCADLPAILGTYYVSRQLELKGILFDASMAGAFAQVDASAWADCELVVHNCDFRMLSVDAFAALLTQLAPTRLHFKGTLELPEGCPDLLELSTIQAAVSLKFSHSDGAAPSVKIDAEKLCKWLHSGGDQPRYVSLQHEQIAPDLVTLLNVFRRESQMSQGKALFLVDVHTKDVPGEIFAGRVVQVVQHESCQRLNIRYDLVNLRVIFKRYVSGEHQAAKTFEQQMRIRMGAVAPHKRHPWSSRNVPEYFDVSNYSRPNGATHATAAAEEGAEDRSDISSASKTEHASCTSSASNEDENKTKFLACVGVFFGTLYDTMRDKGSLDEVPVLQQRMADLVAEFEQAANLL